MTTVTALESALGEMDYKRVDGEFNEYDCSIPAQFSCDPPAQLNEQALEDEFERKNVGIFIEYTSRRDDKFCCNFEVYDTENHSRTTVKAMSTTVRVHPGDNGPTKGALAEITSAIESAFETTLEHDPIDD